MSDLLNINTDEFTKSAEILNRYFAQAARKYDELASLREQLPANIFSTSIEISDQHGRIELIQINLGNLQELTAEQTSELNTILNGLLKGIASSKTPFNNYNIQKSLVISAQKEIASIEIEKELKKPQNDSSYKIGFRKAMVRAMTVAGVTFALLFIGYIQSKFQDLKPPEVSIVSGLLNRLF